MPCHAIVHVVALTLIFANWPVIAMAQDAPSIKAEHERVVQRFDKAIRAIKNIRQHIDRSQFDLDALLQKLDFDLDKIVQFVNEEVRFQQYSGLLRSGRGTLMSRAGNALDQSILLATLLRDAGYDARIVETILNDNQAKALLEGMKIAVPDSPSLGNDDAIRTILLELADKTDFPTSDLDQLLNAADNKSEFESFENVAAVRSETDFILDLLRENDISFNSSSGIHDLIDEAKEYFYVEVRDGSDSSWRPVHPALAGNASIFEDLHPVTYFVDSIPDSYHHTFQFQIVLTTHSQGNQENRSLLSTWERPVSNLLGVPLTYTNISKNMLDSNFLESSELKEPGVDLFLPALNGDIQNSGFDLQGNIIPADAAVSMFAGVFQAVSDKLGSAAQALFDLQSDISDEVTAVRELSTLEIKYSLTDPDGGRQEYVRTIFDVAKHGRGDDKYVKTLQALTRNYTIAVGGGTFPPAFVLDQIIAELLAREAAIRAAIDYNFGSIGSKELQAALSTETATYWSGHPLLELIQGSFNNMANGTTTYFSGPSIVVHYRELPLTGSAIEAVDIVTRTQTTRFLETLELAPTEQVMAGVWETFHEGSLFEYSVEAFNTRNVFDRARNGSNSFLVVDSEEDVISQLKLPDLVIKNIRRDLDDGYVLILPRQPSVSKNPRDYAWWRIDPVSGRTLGVSGTGEGMTATEYITAGLILFGSLLMYCLLYSHELRRDPNNPRPGRAGGGISRCVGFAGASTGGTFAAFGTLALSAPLGPIGMLLAAVALLNWALMFPDPN